MIKRIFLILIPAGCCIAGAIWLHSRSQRAPATVTAVPWHQYPATASAPYAPKRLPDPADVQPTRIAPIRRVAHEQTTQFRPDTHYLDRYSVQQAGYDNIIHPDEDLLRPNEALAPPAAIPNAAAPQPPAPQAGPRPLPDNQTQTPPSEPPFSPADPNSLRNQSTAPIAEPSNAEPPTQPQDTKRYDPNQPPAEDEDLLTGPGGPATQTSPDPTTQTPSQPAAPAETPHPQTEQTPAPEATPNRGTPEGAAAPTTPETPPAATAAPQTPATGQPSAPSAHSRDDIIVESTETPPIEHVPPPAEPNVAPSETLQYNPTAPHSVPGTPAPNLPGAPHGSMKPPASSFPPGVDPHAEAFSESLFPSATKCKECHEQIYDEWASSSHAYAAVSPMFQKFEQAINNLTRGTIGYFCMRCHAPVATWLGQPRHILDFESMPSAKEGVTCVACHRVSEAYGKVNGERRMEPGPLTDPVYGAGYGEGLAEVLGKKDYYKIKSPGDSGPGQEIHQQVIHFEQISSSHFCAPCHQVAVAPGIGLEVVWAQYRASPAHAQGITCQECHMGREPGVAAGYDCGPVAVVNGKPVSPHRKHSNHLFYGPGYSIAHPGIFPFNEEQEDWTMDEWLEFDYRAGWGTDEFEDQVADGLIQCNFPEAWKNADDRYDARDIVAENLKKLDEKRHLRHRLMENGSHVEGPIFKRPPQRGKPLRFHYVVENRNIGHNMPSGSLGAQPQLWLNVALTGPNGEHLWESGYVDSNGDMADLHSLDVAEGRIARDQQLVNFQTKFLVTNTKGTDREIYLPLAVDLDQLPFIRPSGFPITVMNHPPFIRMEAHSVPATGSREATYRVPAHLMSRPGKYRLSVRMRSRAEPIYFMRFCRATPEMERNMNEWMLNFHEQSFEFFVP